MITIYFNCTTSAWGKKTQTCKNVDRERTGRWGDQQKHMKTHHPGQLSSALLGPQLKDIQGCLPLLYIQLATARESTGKGSQSWPECVLWAQLTTANDVKGKSKEKAERSLGRSCVPGCIHTANQTGLKQNLSPKLFTLQSVKGHIFKLTWTATRTWGKKVWSRPLGQCECVRSTSTRFPDKSECLMLIKCLVIC